MVIQLSIKAVSNVQEFGTLTGEKSFFFFFLFLELGNVILNMAI